MSFLKKYSRFINVFSAIAVLVVIGWCGYVWAFHDTGIVNYKSFRDKAAIKSMFHDDWQLLYYGDFDKIHETDFNVDFMLDNRSSSQYAAHSNLVLKVMRDAGKTVGFLAYYPKSPYWWHMLFLIVDKNHRGKGYASKMVQFFIDDAVARGALKLTTFTRLINTPARSVYEGKFGFKDIGHPEDKYLDLVLYPNKK
jgi:ribosomal protein S18 acetylase RimI-like enzyme